MDEQRIIEIETKLAYQEQMLSELNQALTDQQAQLSSLERVSRRLVERLESLGEAGEGGEDLLDERPRIINDNDIPGPEPGQRW